MIPYFRESHTKACVLVLLVSAAIVFIAVLWLTKNSEEAKSSGNGQTPETTEPVPLGECTVPGEGQALVRRAYFQKAHGLPESVQDIPLLNSASGGENNGTPLSSSTDEVVRRLLAQRIASGEIRSPRTGVQPVGDSSRIVGTGLANPGRLPANESAAAVRPESASTAVTTGVLLFPAKKKTVSLSTTMSSALANPILTASALCQIVVAGVLGGPAWLGENREPSSLQLSHICHTNAINSKAAAPEADIAARRRKPLRIRTLLRGNFVAVRILAASSGSATEERS